MSDWEMGEDVFGEKKVPEEWVADALISAETRVAELARIQELLASDEVKEFAKLARVTYF